MKASIAFRVATRWFRGEHAKDGSSVGLFMRLPHALASKFPHLGDEDPSPPHVTFLILGDLRSYGIGRALAVVEDSLKHWWPKTKATLGPVDYFPQPDQNRKVAYTSVAFDKDLAGLRERVKHDLKTNGFNVEDKFPNYTPHVTLAYMDGLDSSWEGPVPTGTWNVTEVEVWGLPSSRRIVLGKT